MRGFDSISNLSSHANLSLSLSLDCLTNIRGESRAQSRRNDGSIWWVWRKKAATAFNYQPLIINQFLLYAKCLTPGYRHFLLSLSKPPLSNRFILLHPTVITADRYTHDHLLHRPEFISIQLFHPPVSRNGPFRFLRERRTNRNDTAMFLKTFQGGKGRCWKILQLCKIRKSRVGGREGRKGNNATGKWRPGSQQRTLEQLATVPRTDISLFLRESCHYS